MHASTTDMNFSLDDRIVVLTGAAGRLGGVVLDVLDTSGATVAALVLNDEEAQRVSLSAGGATFQADATDEESVREAFVQIHDRFGRIDVLIHTIGMWKGEPFLETSADSWEQMMHVNLTSTFLCFQEAVRQMRPREDDDPPARLIAVSSAQGADGGVAQQAPYSASKAGVIRLVEAVSAEFEEEGITAHAIAPSMILYDESTLGESAIDESAAAKGVSARRLAELCLYLCTDAGEALSGSVLRAYGNFG